MSNNNLGFTQWLYGDPSPDPSFGTTTNTQTATEVRTKTETTEKIVRELAERIDAEMFKLMASGTLSGVDYAKLFSSLHVCVDCGKPYLLQSYNMTRDLPTTHCPSCEDAQKEAAGLK